MAVASFSRTLLLLAAWFLANYSTGVQAFIADSVSVVVPRQSHKTQLSMALALPTSRPSILKKKKWSRYEETLPIKQRMVYNDDFDLYDDNGNFLGNAPFRGIKSLPIVFTPSASVATMAAPQRKRDKLKRVAKWAFQKVRRS